MDIYKVLVCSVLEAASYTHCLLSYPFYRFQYMPELALRRHVLYIFLTLCLVTSHCIFKLAIWE